MTNTNKIITAIVIIAIILIGVGYAGLSNIALKIEGNATADANTANFVVGFTGTPNAEVTSAVPAVGVTAKATATIDSNDSTKATINITNLTAKDDKVVATYTVKNSSKDLAAKLTTSTTSTNTDYTVTSSLAEEYLKPDEITTVTVTIVLNRTPITTQISEAVGIKVEAQPIQQSEIPA